MIKEEYIQFHTAKLLKDAGFPQDIKQTMFYNKFGQDWHMGDHHWTNGFAKPSQAQAMRWLREHHIHVSVRNRIYDKQWDCMLLDINGKIAIPQDSLNYVRDYKDYWVTFPSYEAAAEAGIQAACRYIINQNKSL